MGIFFAKPKQEQQNYFEEEELEIKPLLLLKQELLQKLNFREAGKEVIDNASDYEQMMMENASPKSPSRTMKIRGNMPGHFTTDDGPAYMSRAVDFANVQFRNNIGSPQLPVIREEKGGQFQQEARRYLIKNQGEHHHSEKWIEEGNHSRASAVAGLQNTRSSVLGQLQLADNENNRRVLGYQNESCLNHFFEVFITYRFIDSFRQRLTDNDLWEVYKEELIKKPEWKKKFMEDRKKRSISEEIRIDKSEIIRNFFGSKSMKSNQSNKSSSTTPFFKRFNLRSFSQPSRPPENNQPGISLQRGGGIQRQQSIKDFLERKNKNPEPLPVASSRSVNIMNQRQKIKQLGLGQEKQKEAMEIAQALLKEKNMIAATWMNDLCVPQKEMEQKRMFFSNETLLLREDINSHFDPKHMKAFNENYQEFVCLKGNNLEGPDPKKDKHTAGTRFEKMKDQFRSMNKDSFFSIMDGNTKIIGLFSGHGECGHLVSAAAMGIMLDYLRNRNDVFTQKNLHSSTSAEIRAEIKKAFKYTQQVLREDHEFNKELKKQERQKAKQEEAARQEKLNEEKKAKQKILLQSFKAKLEQESMIHKRAEEEIQLRIKPNKDAGSQSGFSVSDGSLKNLESCRPPILQIDNINSDFNLTFASKQEQRGFHSEAVTPANKGILLQQTKVPQIAGDPTLAVKILEESNSSIPQSQSNLTRGDKSATTPKRESTQKMMKEVNQFLPKMSLMRAVKDTQTEAPPRSRSRSSDPKGMNDEQNFRTKCDKVKEDIGIKEHFFKQSYSVWESDLSQEDYCNDMFQAHFFDEEIETENEQAEETKSQPLYTNSVKRFTVRDTIEMAKDEMTSKKKNGKRGWQSIREVLQKTQTLNFLQRLASKSKPDEGRINFRIYLAKRQLQQFIVIRRELIMRARLHRKIQLNDNMTLKMINNRPEIRFRTTRFSTRFLIRKTIKKEVAITQKRINFQTRMQSRRSSIHIQSNKGSTVSLHQISRQTSFQKKDMQEDFDKLSKERQGKMILFKQASSNKMQLNDYKSESSSMKGVDENLSSDDSLRGMIQEISSESSSQKSQSSSSEQFSDISIQREIEEQLLYEEAQMRKNTLIESSLNELMKSIIDESNLQDRLMSIESIEPSRNDQDYPYSPETKKQKEIELIARNIREKYKQDPILHQILTEQNYNEEAKIQASLNYLVNRQRMERAKERYSRLNDPNYGEEKKAQIKRIRDAEFVKRLATRDESEFNIDISMSGTTCSLVIMIGDNVFVGFVGDSLVCLSRILTAHQEQNVTNMNLILTLPFHTPDNPREKQKIYQRKGEVRGKPLVPFPLPKEEMEDSQQTTEESDYDFQPGLFDQKRRSRVYIRGRMYPGLPISRSLGDYTAHRIGVSSEPSIQQIKLNKQNEYLVIATSALWNMMTPKQVFDFIKSHLSLGIGNIAKSLAMKVKDYYVYENLAIPDITIIIQYLV